MVRSAVAARASLVDFGGAHFLESIILLTSDDDKGSEDLDLNMCARARGVDDNDGALTAIPWFMMGTLLGEPWAAAN